MSPQLGLMPGETGGIPDFLRQRRNRIQELISQLGIAGGPFSTEMKSPTSGGGSAAGMGPAPNPTTEAQPQPQTVQGQPLRSQQLQQEYNQFTNPPVPPVKNRILNAIGQVAPIALGGLFGGEAGAAGAAGGVEEYTAEKAALREQRRKELQAGIQSQLGRESTMDIEAARERAAMERERAAQEFQTGTATTAFGRQQQLAGEQAAAAQALERLRQEKPDQSITEFDVFREMHKGEPDLVEKWLKLKAQFPKPDSSITPFDVFRQQKEAAGLPVDLKEYYRMQPAMQGLPSLIELRGAQAGQIKEAQETRELYTKERANRTVNAIDEIVPLVNNMTAGAGSLLGNLPLTGARTLRAKLDTLKANITQNELAQMRATSRSGGALGAVSDREGNLLANSLGAIDQGMNPEDLKKELTNIKGIVQRYQQAVEATGGAAPKPGAPGAGGGEQEWIRDPKTGKLRPK
jgi:hypothetical protein